jgi:exopolysaccharide production protein ExoY
MYIYSTDIRSQNDATPVVLPKKLSKTSRYRTVGKRALDLTLILTTAWFTVPIILILVVAIMATGQKPFYVQERIGLGGKNFKIWKLQTMLPNAKQRLETYLASNPEARAEWDSKQKLVDDPRITPLGSFLRSSSMDELPQLINVLNGTMSLIGPRPMMPEQKSQYSGKAYYKLRPGMSGLWQVSKRSEGDFSSRVRYDEQYDVDVSLTTDVRVLVQTVGVVLRGTGI